MTLIFASVNKVARNQYNVGILIVSQLRKAFIYNGGRFRYAFLVGTAAGFVCRTLAFERGIVIMKVGAPPFLIFGLKYTNKIPHIEQICNIMMKKTVSKL